MQQITDVKAKFRRVFLSHFFTEYAYKQSGIVVRSGAGKSVILSRDCSIPRVLFVYALFAHVGHLVKVTWNPSKLQPEMHLLRYEVLAR